MWDPIIVVGPSRKTSNHPELMPHGIVSLAPKAISRPPGAYPVANTARQPGFVTTMDVVASRFGGINGPPLIRQTTTVSSSSGARPSSSVSHGTVWQYHRVN